MIPKKINYCWFGSKELPSDVKKCINSWKQYCPDYEIIRWDESNFNVNQHPFVREAYKAKAWAFVSDYARLKIIYDNGGIYLDTDVELLRNIDYLLSNPAYIGVQQAEQLCNTGLGFGAERNNEIIGKMLKKYDSITFSSDRVKEFACPYLNNEVLTELGYQYQNEIWNNGLISVYPCRYFDPIAPGNTKNLLCDETVSIHHYAASWTGKINRLKRKLFRLIGEENIRKIKNFIHKGTNL